MSAAKPRYTKAGLGVSEAYVYANRIALINALADEVVSGRFSDEEGTAFLKKITDDVGVLMRDGAITVAEGVVAELALGNFTFHSVDKEISNEAEELSNDIDKELENV